MITKRIPTGHNLTILLKLLWGSRPIQMDTPTGTLHVYLGPRNGYLNLVFRVVEGNRSTFYFRCLPGRVGDSDYYLS